MYGSPVINFFLCLCCNLLNIHREVSSPCNRKMWLMNWLPPTICPIISPQLFPLLTSPPWETRPLTSDMLPQGRFLCYIKLGNYYIYSGNPLGYFNVRKNLSITTIYIYNCFIVGLISLCCFNCKLYYAWWKQIKVCRKFWTRNWYLRTELKGRVLKFYKLVKDMQIYISTKMKFKSFLL